MHHAGPDRHSLRFAIENRAGSDQRACPAIEDQIAALVQDRAVGCRHDLLGVRAAVEPDADGDTPTTELGPSCADEVNVVNLREGPVERGPEIRGRWRLDQEALDRPEQILGVVESAVEGG